MSSFEDDNYSWLCRLIFNVISTVETCTRRTNLTFSFALLLHTYMAPTVFLLNIWIETVLNFDPSKWCVLREREFWISTLPFFFPLRQAIIDVQFVKKERGVIEFNKQKYENSGRKTKKSSNCEDHESLVGQRLSPTLPIIFSVIKITRWHVEVHPTVLIINTNPLPNIHMLKWSLHHIQFFFW